MESLMPWFNVDQFAFLILLQLTFNYDTNTEKKKSSLKLGLAPIVCGINWDILKHWNGGNVVENQYMSLFSRVLKSETD
jgi:hypothetical protein